MPCMFMLQSVSRSELACPKRCFVSRLFKATLRLSATFVPIAEAPLPQPSEVSGEPTSISNLIDMEDSRNALTGANLPHPSVTHVRIATKGEHKKVGGMVDPWQRS
jgi:hypothetical protein